MGLWYVMPDKLAEAGPGVTAEQIIEAERAEYRAWVKGEVYGYVIEESVEWGRRDGEPGSMTTWTMVDECWGFIGHEYARTSALGEFASYRARKRKGKCPHCGYPVPLAPDGLTMFHGDVNRMVGDCLGSREKPLPG